KYSIAPPSLKNKSLRRSPDFPERLGSGLSGTGGLLVSESVSVAEDCDRSGTTTSVDGTPVRKMNPIPCSDP
ncbi:hypothetical protein TNCT_6361, partial [Trichonephila clavata]